MNEVISLSRCHWCETDFFVCVCSNNRIVGSAFIKHVSRTTRMNKDGRVCIEMPWKRDIPGKLPNNYYAAIGQMIRRENQLTKSGKIEQYIEEITNLVKREVVTILTPDEAKTAPHEPSSRKVLGMLIDTKEGVPQRSSLGQPWYTIYGVFQNYTL